MHEIDFKIESSFSIHVVTIYSLADFIVFVIVWKQILKINKRNFIRKDWLIFLKVENWNLVFVSKSKNIILIF